MSCAACTTAPSARLQHQGISWRTVEHDRVTLETWSTADPKTGLPPVHLVPGMTGTAKHPRAWATLVEAPRLLT